jgi:hypothetical protein
VIMSLGTDSVLYGGDVGNYAVRCGPPVLVSFLRGSLASGPGPWHSTVPSMIRIMEHDLSWMRASGKLGRPTI